MTDTIANTLTNEERETHFNITADDRHTCIVTTDDPVWFARLIKWFTPDWNTGQAAQFTVPTALVIRENALTKGTNKLNSLEPTYYGGSSDVE